MKKIIILVIPLIVITLLILGNTNLEQDSDYSQISEYDVEIIGPNVHFLVKTVKEIPNEFYPENQQNSLAFGYLWIEKEKEQKEFQGVFTNHHLINEPFDQGWHTELVKASVVSNSDNDFCLEFKEIFSEIMVSENTLLTITPLEEINLKNINKNEIYLIETEISEECSSNMGARVIQHHRRN